MIKACLFDLDGVVFDTEPKYTIFWGGIFREFYPDSEGLELKIKGQTLGQIYAKYFPDEGQQAEITRRLDEYEEKMSYEYVARVEAYVGKLRSEGIRTAIVTSSNRAKMEQVYRQHPSFKELFDGIFTAEDFRASKPAPDGYLTAAARLGVEPKECVVFEDSFNGMKSGLAANMRVVGVATTNTIEAMKKYTDEVIEDFTAY